MLVAPMQAHFANRDLVLTEQKGNEQDRMASLLTLLS